MDGLKQELKENIIYIPTEQEREIIRAVVGVTMYTEFMDNFRVSGKYKGRVKQLSRELFGILRKELKSEAGKIAQADEGIFGEIIDAQFDSVELFSKLKLETMIMHKSLIERIVEFEKQGVDYVVNIDVKNDEEE